MELCAKLWNVSRWDTTVSVGPAGPRTVYLGPVSMQLLLKTPENRSFFLTDAICA